MDETNRSNTLDEELDTELLPLLLASIDDTDDDNELLPLLLTSELDIEDEALDEISLSERLAVDDDNNELDIELLSLLLALLLAIELDRDDESELLRLLLGMNDGDEDDEEESTTTHDSTTKSVGYCAWKVPTVWPGPDSTSPYVTSMCGPKS